ncbi:hypothetical protein CASFOL_030786 [Castilleja foliolosa]|uniref:C2 NT-type domain-containing protein n=1 Tax=Castilleja foliolosa TaxID=1961234 RepID=A0ABD3C6Y7_9LAMI
MFSKTNSRKKDENDSGKFINDLETISKALYTDKMSISRSKSFENPRLPNPKQKKKKPKKISKDDASKKDKKPSIWTWKGLKALTNARTRRFNCCFSLLVHSIDNLPAIFDDVCLVVHWKRRDGEQMTRPVKVFQGVAEIEEQLTHSCSVYGTKSGPHHFAKYEAKHFLLYVSVYNANELDLGKHRVDLTRLLPLTLEELEDEKSSGKWTTSFGLSGKARGATMNVSFGYVVIANNNNNNNHKSVPDSPRKDSEKEPKLGGRFDLSDKTNIICRVESLPARLNNLDETSEDIKDLHEVFPESGPELSECEKVHYQKLDEEASDALDGNKSVAGEMVCETKREISELHVMEKGIEELSRETDVEETICQKDEQQSISSKESLMKELETALSHATDLVNEGLDSEEDEENDHVLGLDTLADSVANDFLDMLGIDRSPSCLSSESDPESPRERLLKQFEKDNGGLLDLEIENDHISMVSAWEDISTELPNLETSGPRIQTRASEMEGLENEALMREWGLDEEAFQSSPMSNSSGYGSPVDEPMAEIPGLVEGLSPFARTKNGGFLRSMKPGLFESARNGGSLVMQVSSPVVVPAEMGSGVMDVLQGLAALGIEKLSMQANRLMPLEDVAGRTIQQIAWEAGSFLEGPERQGLLQHESTKTTEKSVKRIISSEYVAMEDLAPLAMDKIEALSIEGLRIQSGMSDEGAPSNITAQSIGEFSALKGNNSVNFAGGPIDLNGTGGLQLLDIKLNDGQDVDGLIGLSLTLDEWIRFDSGEIEDHDLFTERTSKILTAHHATSLDAFCRKSRRVKGRKYGLLGNNFTVALMVQLRDPLRNYEPVGSPMLSLVQVERVFVPPKLRIYKNVPPIGNISEEEEEDKHVHAKEEEAVIIPQYKITEVHVAGLKVGTGKKKLWGSVNQEQAGSRWLLANGMGKKYKHPLMKAKPVVKNLAQPGDTLWSISSRAHGKGDNWKDIRNPNDVFASENIRKH